MNKLKLHSTVLILVSMFFSISAFAQDYTFTVLGSKGTNTMGSASIKVGTKIKDGATVKVGLDGYLGLAHKSFKTLEITKPGEYKVSDLESMLGNAEGDLASKYAKFVMDELTSGNSSSSRFNRKAKTGSVTRSLHKKPILFLMPVDENGISKTSKVLADSKITIKWYVNNPNVLDTKSNVQYKFVVKDGSPLNIGKVIYDAEITGESVTIDLSDARFNDSKMLLYQVVVMNNSKAVTSDELMLNIVNPMHAGQMGTEVKILEKDESALGKMVLAKYFEEHNLIANAIHAYEEAIEISEAPEFITSYNSFLEFYQLSSSSREVSAGK